MSLSTYATGTRTQSSWVRNVWGTFWTGRVNDQPERARTLVLHNETPWPIRVEGGGKLLGLAPLERREVSEAEIAGLRLDRLLGLRKIRLYAVRGRRNNALGQGARLAVLTVVLWLALLAPLGNHMWAWRLTGGIALLCCAVILFLLLTRPGGDAEARLVQRWTWQSLTMVVVLIVSVVAPALALWYGTDLHKNVHVGNGHVVQTDRPLELIGRLLQLTFIAVASMLPALMFFQFDAEKLSTQRDRWLQNIFRLDPTVSSISDVEAKYGSQLEEAYGTKGDGHGRLTRGRRSPLIVSTIVVTFGWLLILINARVPGPSTAPDSSLQFTDLLAPSASVIAYAFLGAYFFAVNLVYNSYVRGDLRPKTYNLITLRIFTVVIIAWLIDVATKENATKHIPVYLVAFAAGLVPRTVLHYLFERLPFKTNLADVSGTADQLVTLDGIDLYERTRLSDEGISSLQALANHDLVDLFFKTRIAPSRLVDWVDQATLQVHLVDPGSQGRKTRDYAKALVRLRAIGIRTATDFIEATEACVPGTREPSKASVSEADFARALAWVRPDQELQREDIRRRIASIRQSLCHDEWPRRISYWKTSVLVNPEWQARYFLADDGCLHQPDVRFCGMGELEPQERVLDLASSSKDERSDGRSR